jgi:hypothetical protein
MAIVAPQCLVVCLDRLNDITVKLQAERNVFKEMRRDGRVGVLMRQALCGEEEAKQQKLFRVEIVDDEDVASFGSRGKVHVEFSTQLVACQAESIRHSGGDELEHKVAAVLCLALLEEHATGDFAKVHEVSKYLVFQFQGNAFECRRCWRSASHGAATLGVCIRHRLGYHRGRRSNFRRSVVD